MRGLGLINTGTADRFLTEQVRAGALLGTNDLPATRTEVESSFAAVHPELVASPVATTAVHAMTPRAAATSGRRSVIRSLVIHSLVIR